MNKNALRKQILELMDQSPGQSFKTRDIYKQLELPNEDYRALKDLLLNMAESNQLNRYKGNRYGAFRRKDLIDGVLHVIPDDLRWEYDRTQWTRPWRVTDPSGGRVDLEFRPAHERRDRMQLGVLFNETHQCFGTWRGVMVDDHGSSVSIDGVRGWAEEVRNRW